MLQDSVSSVSANVRVCLRVQLIIAEDGACGMCAEHSPAEGIVVTQLIEHLLAYTYAISPFQTLNQWHHKHRAQLPSILWRI